MTPLVWLPLLALAVVGVVVGLLSNAEMEQATDAFLRDLSMRVGAVCLWRNVAFDGGEAWISSCRVVFSETTDPEIRTCPECGGVVVLRRVRRCPRTDA